MSPRLSLALSLRLVEGRDENNAPSLGEWLIALCGIAVVVLAWVPWGGE